MTVKSAIQCHGSSEELGASLDEGDFTGESSSQLTTDTAMDEFTDCSSSSESIASETDCLIHDEGDHERPVFHPHQIYWDSDRSTSLFHLSLIFLLASGGGVIDITLQIAQCGILRRRM